MGGDFVAGISKFEDAGHDAAGVPEDVVGQSLGGTYVWLATVFGGGGGQSSLLIGSAGGGNGAGAEVRG